MQIFSILLLAVVTAIRYRCGIQKYGSLTVSITMVIAAFFFFTGMEILAVLFQGVGVTTALVLICIEEQWKRKEKKS